MSSKLRVVQVRAVPEKGNLDANLETLASVLEGLDSREVDVVVTPECFLDGYVATEERVTREGLAAYAVDPARSPHVARVAGWAQARGVWVILGCSRREGAGVFNSALVLDRGGRLAGVYDKTHCQTHDRKYLPGNSLPVFESDFGRFGIVICADRRWPETIRALALKGARVVFNPTYGMHDERNLRMMQTRSYESEVFVAFTHPRQSLVTDPSGGILCNEADPRSRFSLTELDLAEVDRARAGESAHLRDLRPDLYRA